MTKFKEYKEKLFMNNIEEILINKKVNIRNKEIQILSFIKDNNYRNTLWTVEKKSIGDNEEFIEAEIISNREEYRDRILRNNKYNNIHISQMKIQNQIINFTSSQGVSIEYAYGEQLNIIRHFIDNGLLGEEWDDVNVNDIIFGVYEQDEEEVFSKLNYSENINISLQIQEDIREELIEHPFKVKIKKLDKGTIINYKDKSGLEDYFYLDEIIKYDLHKDTLEKIEANINEIDEEYRDSYRRDMMEGIENICPKDMDAVAIYYETKDNTQLTFYTKKHLESKPLYNMGCTTALWLSDEYEGINGYHKNVDMLCPVEKDFNGEIEIELFSRYEKIPMEEISFEIENNQKQD